MGGNVTLGDYLDFWNGSAWPAGSSGGCYPVCGANGVIGSASTPNARGPLIVIGRVGSYCGSMRYHDSDVWVTDNAVACRAKCPEETRYWYYALQSCGLNRFRAGSSQPLLSQSILRNVSVQAAAAPDRPKIGDVLGALDDKVAANERVIAAAEAFVLALVERVADHVTLSTLARSAATVLDPQRFEDRVALYSFAAFDEAARPTVVDRRMIKSAKFIVKQPCVLFAKLNPRIPRIWNVASLPSEMALASTEFVVLRPVDVDTSALWSALRQPEVLAGLRQQVVGMTGSRQRIQPRDLLQVRVPDVRRLTTEQAQAVSSLGALCHCRRVESAWLASRRDALLPLLVHGKVRVKDAERNGADCLSSSRFPFAVRAVAGRLSECDIGDSARADFSCTAAGETLRELDALLTDHDKRRIRQDDLYDANGLLR